MNVIEKWIAELEALAENSVFRSRYPAGSDRVKYFAQLLKEARLRAARGELPPETPITQKMLDDPVYGEFWRRMKQARERVRRLRGPDNP